MMVQTVVSIATLPHRTSMLRQTLASVAAQTVKPDRVNICIPRKCERFPNVPYPDELVELTKEAGVRLIRCWEDYGPATKLLGTVNLDYELSEADSVVTLDDDVLIPNWVIEQLTRYRSELPNCLLGFCGYKVVSGQPIRHPHLAYAFSPQAPEPVTSLGGFAAVLYPEAKKHFSEIVHEFEHYPQDGFFVDDDWFAGCAAKRGLERMVIPFPPQETRFISECFACHLSKNDPLALNAGANAAENIERQSRFLTRLVDQGVLRRF